MGSSRTCLRRAFGDLDAVIHHHDVVGDFHHHRHVVLDQQDRGALIGADREQQFAQARRFRARSARRRARRGRAAPARCTSRARFPAAAGRHRADCRRHRRRGRAARCDRARSAPDRSRACSALRQDGAPIRPRNVSPEARISALCCATIRFSSAVMPGNSRMFWKVRATGRVWKSGNRSAVRAGWCGRHHA